MTEQQVAALEQWAKREHDYATEMGCGTDYTSVNKLRDVLALCAAWREGQETQGAAAEALAALKAGTRCRRGPCRAGAEGC